MAIPAFYKWLIKKYPRVFETAIEDTASNNDTNSTNPIGPEFDNLYVDMNVIIHGSFDLCSSTLPENIFQHIFDNLDRLFAVVRPRKLLYLAIDGVAPRAKINQQRSRRFRASKRSTDKACDANVITPGTQFMEELSEAFRYWIQSKLSSDIAWKHVKVILSDGNVPGEGEHKIVQFIRKQRAIGELDFESRHCIYGLDADIIVLALATHEQHISILREDRDKSTKVYGNGKELLQLQFLHISHLRECLESEFKDKLPGCDIERIVDDFVFMCLFLGNDFIPVMPSLDVNGGGIDLLMDVYVKQFRAIGGYLTDSGVPVLKRVEHFIKAVADRKCVTKDEKMLLVGGNKQGVTKYAIHEKKLSIEGNKHGVRIPQVLNVGESLGEIWKRNGVDINEVMMILLIHVLGEEEELLDRGMLLILINLLCQEAELVKTTYMVKKIHYNLSESRKIYYKEKFNGSSDSIIHDAAKKYVEGLCWVMRYYCGEVPSWQWYYPYYYAPYPSEMIGIGNLCIDFEVGEPFKPLEQLMAVLPPSSAHALPESYRSLMVRSDSPIIHYYPAIFQVDFSARKLTGQVVVKLPFIDQSLLINAVSKAEKDLTDVESRRNRARDDLLFVSTEHPMAALIKDLILWKGKDVKVVIDPRLSNGLDGSISFFDEQACPPILALPGNGGKSVSNNDALCVAFDCSSQREDLTVLPDVITMPKKLSDVTTQKSVNVKDMQVKTSLYQTFQSQNYVVKSISDRKIGETACRGYATFRNCGNQFSSAITKHNTRQQTCFVNAMILPFSWMKGKTFSTCGYGVPRNHSYGSNTCISSTYKYPSRLKICYESFNNIQLEKSCIWPYPSNRRQTLKCNHTTVILPLFASLCQYLVCAAEKQKRWPNFFQP